MAIQPEASTYDPADAAAPAADAETRPRSVRGYLTRGAAATFAMKVGGVGLTFVAGILLARLLEPAGYGAYSYALAWMTVCLLLATVGTDRLVVREVAACYVHENWSGLVGVLRWASRAVSVIAVAVALAAAAAAWLFGGRALSPAVLAFWVAAPMIPITGLSVLLEARLRGLRRVVIGQTSETLIKPALLVIALLGLRAVIGGTAHPATAMLLYAAAATAALALNAVLAARYTPSDASPGDAVLPKDILVALPAPLVIVGGMRLLNSRADMIMLGAMKGMWHTGIYAAASRGAMLVTFILLSVNAALAPVIAALHAQGDRERLQRVVTQAARITLALTIPVAAGLCIFRVPFLRLFGEEFPQGQVALMILAAGQLVNTAAGSVGILLMMTGHERHAAVGTAVGALNVALNALLIGPFGIAGAAVATATSTAVMFVLMAWMVRRTLAIDPTALGMPPKRGRGHV